MRRIWKSKTDEKQAASLEDTQEYLLPKRAEAEPDPPEVDESGVDDPVVDEPGPEHRVEAPDQEDDFYDDYAELVGDDFDDDDFYDDEPDDFDEGLDEVESPPASEAPATPIFDRLRELLDSTSERLDVVTGKLDAAWLAAVERVDRVSRPVRAKLDRRLLAGISVVVVVSIVVGLGAYFIARGSGEDIDVARLEGEVAGKQAGAIEGATEGYAAGFKKGREKGFLKAYRATYRQYFKRAFRQAGLDAPPDKKIVIPKP